MLLNTWIKLCTVVASVLEAIRYGSSQSDRASKKVGSELENVPWTTVATTSLRWEAELMQQILAAHDIPARVIDRGVEAYMGQGSPAALQVQMEDEQSAILLLSVPDAVIEASE